MDEERPLHETLLDLVIYAPVGVVLVVAEELPRLAEKGRERVEGQIKMARVVGKFAVRQAEKRVRRVVSGETRPAGPSPASNAGGPTAPDTSRSAAAAQTRSANGTAASKSSAAAAYGVERNGKSPAPSRPAATVSPSSLSGPSTPARQKPSTGPVGGSAVPLATSLAIPGYDTLAASQVVQRLSSLRPDELEAIRLYEAATRGRRTILHRVSQLTSTDTRASI